MDGKSAKTRKRKADVNTAASSTDDDKNAGSKKTKVNGAAWTTEMEAELLKLARSSVRIKHANAMATFGRSRIAIAKRLAKVRRAAGIQFEPLKPWTDDMNAELLEMASSGTSTVDLAKHFGRTTIATRVHLNRLSKRKIDKPAIVDEGKSLNSPSNRRKADASADDKLKPASKRPKKYAGPNDGPLWTPAMIAELSAMASTGKTTRDAMAKHFDRSRSSLVRQLNLLRQQQDGWKIIQTKQRPIGPKNNPNQPSDKRRQNWKRSLRQTIADRQNRLCKICGEKLHEQFDLDHIIPVVRNGSHNPDNLQALHPACHLVKSRREQSELMTLIAKYGSIRNIPGLLIQPAKPNEERTYKISQIRPQVEGLAAKTNRLVQIHAEYLSVVTGKIATEQKTIDSLRRIATSAISSEAVTDDDMVAFIAASKQSAGKRSRHWKRLCELAAAAKRMNRILKIVSFDLRFAEGFAAAVAECDRQNNADTERSAVDQLPTIENEQQIACNLPRTGKPVQLMQLPKTKNDRDYLSPVRLRETIGIMLKQSMKLRQLEARYLAKQAKKFAGERKSADALDLIAKTTACADISIVDMEIFRETYKHVRRTRTRFIRWHIFLELIGISSALSQIAKNATDDDK